MCVCVRCGRRRYRQTDRQTDRHTDTHRHRQTYKCSKHRANGCCFHVCVSGGFHPEAGRRIHCCIVHVQDFIVWLCYSLDPPGEGQRVHVCACAGLSLSPFSLSLSVCVHIIASFVHSALRTAKLTNMLSPPPSKLPQSNWRVHCVSFPPLPLRAVPLWLCPTK